MDSRQIDQFLAVFETHNLHEAAEQLYMTQQGLSRSIKKLEDELGAALFQRTSTGVRPTPQAEYLYPYAIDARRRLDQAVQGLRSPSWTKRQLSLPCSAGVLHILHPLLMEFEQSHPDVHVSWKDQSDVDAEADVLQGHAEMGLLTRDSNPRALEYLPLYRSRQTLLVPRDHSLYSLDQVSYADLQGERVACEGADFVVNRQLVSRCLEAGFLPDITETADISLCFRLAQTRTMLAIVPSCIAREFPHPDVRAIPFADPQYCWEFGASWVAHHQLNGDASALLEFLRTNCHKLGTEEPIN